MDEQCIWWAMLLHTCWPLSITAVCWKNQSSPKFSRSLNKLTYHGWETLSPKETDGYFNFNYTHSWMWRCMNNWKNIQSKFPVWSGDLDDGWIQKFRNVYIVSEMLNYFRETTRFAEKCISFLCIDFIWEMFCYDKYSATYVQDHAKTNAGGH